MIKGILWDIDGVLIGEKQGLNCPNPTPDVVAKLLANQANGIPNIICTARLGSTIPAIFPGFSGPFITDNGSLIIDSAGKILQQHTLDKENAKEIVKLMLENNIYTEVYTPNAHYVQKEQANEMTDKITGLQHKAPTVANSLLDICDNESIIKIMPIVPKMSEKATLADLLKPLGQHNDIAWTHTPSLPYQFAIVTAKGVTKKRGAIDVSEILGIPLENMLGVGDTMGDWQFIEMCGYGAAMGNAIEELKEKVRSKGENGYVGKSVDENGAIDIVNHFEREFLSNESYSA